MEQLSKHVSAEKITRKNRRAVFSVRSVPRGYKKGNKLFETVEFREASLPGYEFGSKEIEASELLTAVHWS
jgi:hypothetical protein